jgi:hypothetical protein
LDFKNMTEEYIEYLSSNPDKGKDPGKPDQESQATITGISSDLVGKFCQLSVFPHGTSVDAMFTTPPSAYGFGITSSNTISIDIYSHVEEGEAPWNAANGGYTVGIMGDDLNSGTIDYAGYTTVYKEVLSSGGAEAELAGGHIILIFTG